jgi:hypothetical protein
MAEFSSRAKSILWRQDTGGDEDRKAYNRWKERVEFLASKDGGMLKYNEAVVRASKEFPCLARLFREYDVREYDPNPDSHPHIQHVGTPSACEQNVECDGIEQGYRENLRWAIEAAGETARTGLVPARCPSNTAWYLYEQAIADPKDFLAKVGQVESKGDAAEADRRNIRIAGARSIAEIDGYLSELEFEGEESDESEGTT